MTNIWSKLKVTSGTEVNAKLRSWFLAFNIALQTVYAGVKNMIIVKINKQIKMQYNNTMIHCIYLTNIITKYQNVIVLILMTHNSCVQQDWLEKSWVLIWYLYSFIHGLNKMKYLIEIKIFLNSTSYFKIMIFIFYILISHLLTSAASVYWKLNLDLKKTVSWIKDIKKQRKTLILELILIYSLIPTSM